MAPQWALFRHGVLHFHCWDESAVLFNQANLDTHVISLLGYELLTALERVPHSTAENLAVELADLFEAMDRQESEQLIGAALLQLQDIGLVTCDAS